MEHLRRKEYEGLFVLSFWAYLGCILLKVLSLLVQLGFLKAELQKKKNLGSTDTWEFL